MAGEVHRLQVPRAGRDEERATARGGDLRERLPKGLGGRLQPLNTLSGSIVLQRRFPSKASRLKAYAPAPA